MIDVAMEKFIEKGRSKIEITNDLNEGVVFFLNIAMKKQIRSKLTDMSRWQ